MDWVDFHNPHLSQKINNSRVGQIRLPGKFLAISGFYFLIENAHNGIYQIISTAFNEINPGVLLIMYKNECWVREGFYLDPTFNLPNVIWLGFEKVESRLSQTLSENDKGKVRTRAYSAFRASAVCTSLTCSNVSIDFYKNC